MEFTAQNAEYAVSVFYNGEQNDRSKAHTWLTTAQRVPEAWNFLWELLQPSKGTEVQFYGATTLHTKILRCWNEVPAESYEELKNKLLQAVFTYSRGPKIVTNRLCIGLAAFILQQGTADLATILRPLSNVENTMLLLEVLTVIPEEYNSMTMGSSLRGKNRAMLRQACPAVLDDMLRYLQSAYNEFSSDNPPSEQLVQTWTTAATCACSWLTIDGAESDIGPALPERMPLFRALLTAVHVLYSCNEIVSDSALDACEACLSAARACGDGWDAQKHPATALELLALLAALVAPIMQRDSQPNSANEELLSALMTCCVALGVTHARVIVDAVESARDDPKVAGTRQLLDILLAAQGAPGHYPIHETRSNLIFGFWYPLQDEILNTTEEQKTSMCGVWREVFSRLLSVLIYKSEAAPDCDMSKDDLELLRCYRQDIADTLMYCYVIVGSWCWARVEESYSGAQTAARREAALHVFYALADAEPPARAPPALAGLLRHALREAATSTDARMLNTALDAIGSYASWLGSLDAETSSELGQACILAAGGALSRAAPAAALALRRLADDCPGPAAARAEDIVRAAQNSAGQETWTRRQLVGAAGAALAGAQPARAAPLLRDLALTLHEDLIHQALEPRSGGAAECVGALLAALAARPELAGELYRCVAGTLPPFALHAQLVEPLFNILKQTVSALMGDVVPFLGQIGELTAAGCRRQPSASGLDVVKLIIIIAGNEWSGSRELLRSCISSAARALSGGAGGAGAAPDLAEGLFALLTALTKKTPQYLDWIEDLLPDLVELGGGCIRLWAAGAARGACWWLAALAAARAAALRPHAPQLLRSVLRCIGGATPRNQIEPLGELLLALNRAAWGGGAAPLGGWLRAALAPPGFPSAHATDAHKHAFVAAVLKEKSNKRRLLDTVQEFSLVCRGLVGTEYARQSMAAKQLIS